MSTCHRRRRLDTEKDRKNTQKNADIGENWKNGPATRKLSTPPTAGVHPLKLLWHPEHRPPLEVLKSSYTYPDKVNAILSYRRLLQKPKFYRPSRLC